MFPKYMYLQNPFLRAPDDGGTGGDAGGGEGDAGGDDVQTRINAAVEEAVSGLKKTNADLKSEKSDLKNRHDAMAAQFESLGGDDGIKSLVEMRKRLENDETGKLLAEGNHEEWFEKRSGAMKADFQKQLDARDEAIAERDKALEASNAKLHGTLLDVNIDRACDSAEVKNAGAREHARMLAERQFVYDGELGRHVLKDEDGSIVYGKDGRSPKTMHEWIEEKREVAEYRFWWGDSVSAGLKNSSFPQNRDRAMQLLGKTENLREYKALRDKMTGNAA